MRILATITLGTTVTFRERADYVLTTLSDAMEYVGHRAKIHPERLHAEPVDGQANTYRILEREDLMQRPSDN